MKQLFSFVLNTSHVLAMLFTGMGIAYAENVLSLLNVLLLFMVFVFVCMYGLLEHDHTVVKVAKMHDYFLSRIFTLRNWCYYLPAIAVCSWYGFYGTLVLVILAGLTLLALVEKTKQVYLKLSISQANTKTN